MQKMIFATCLATTMVLSTSGGALHQPGNVLTRDDWRLLNEQIHSERDVVLFADGTSLSGTLKELPSLGYTFGPLSFEAEEVATLTFMPKNKMQVITRDGQNYVGTLRDQILPFVGEDGQERHLNLRDLDVVVLTARTAEPEDFSGKRHSLTLANGDQVSVVLGSQPIQLTDGRNSYALNPQEIIDLSFDGGLHGRIQNASGDSTELPFAFVRQPHLQAYLGSSNHPVKLPWSGIEAIQEEPKETYKSLELTDEFLAAADVDFYTEAIATTDIPTMDIVWEESPTIVAVDDNAPLTNFLADAISDEALFAMDTDDELPSLRFTIPANDTAQLFAEAIIDQGLAPKRNNAFISPVQVAKPEEIPSYFEEEEDYLTFAEPEESTPSEEQPQVVHFPDDLDELNGYFDENDWFASSDDDEDQEDIFAQFLEDFKDIFSEDDLEDIFNFSGSFTVNKLEDLHDFLGSFTKRLAGKGTITVNPMIAEEREGMTYVPEVIVEMPGFYIEPRKVTNAEYQRFIRATNYAAPSHWITGVIPPGLDNKPVVNVSYKNALVYAVWAGKRLPTETEIQRAQFAGQVFEDCDDGLCEWTCTPAQPPHSHRGRKKNTPRTGKFHRTVGAKKSSLRNDQCNPKTGFRCVSDAR